MARIPSHEIEQLKEQVSLLRLVEEQGYELKKSGKDYLTRCPFHKDDTASLVVTPTKNLFHCFGCNTGGTVIDWVMKTEGVSFRHAVELLKEQYQPSATTQPIKQSSTNKLPPPLQTDGKDQQLLNQVIDYYHETLKQSPDALAYLEKRGLTNKEMINHFKLGYANRTLGYRLPNKQRKAGAELRGRLQTLGIYRASGHEHFSGSLVIPVLDEHNNVQEVYGRKLLDNLRKGTPLHLYLPGPHKGIFNIQALTACKELILCESLIDALTFWCNGYHNVTASYGVNGFTDHHLAAFKQHNIERVLIAYDRDQAGDEAAEKLSKQLIAEGIDCYRVLFPKGMDANRYALEVTPAQKSLGVAIRSAQWMGKGHKKTITTPITQAEDTLASPQAKRFKQQLEAVATLLEETETPTLPATPVPETPQAPEVNTEQKDHELIFTFSRRRYRIRGFDKNLSYSVMKINVLVTDDNTLHVDTFDLYQSRPRAMFIKQAAIELGLKEDIIKTDIGQLLLKLESLQEQHIKSAQSPPDNTVPLSDEETKSALTLLQSPDLLNKILHDIKHSGLIGEDSNALVAYLACISRKLNNPLAVIIQSTSAAGKSALMDAVLNMMPIEERIQYSAMTGQSLFYMGETNLKHKILAIAEEEGAENASYALKLLQSEGELTIASTGKDDRTGNLVTKEYRVEGPVMLFLTTTAIDIDEELLNRCLVLTVNESREQTQAIHQLQRKKRTLDGLLQQHDKQNLLTLHRNAQRLLKPLHIVNPYADQLTFIDTQTRTRRDHEKYLTLIDSIALLHQYQRKTHTVQHNGETLDYIEVTLSDIEIANQLAHDVLGRTLDELPPQTRKLLTLIDTLVTQRCTEQSIKRSDYRFSRREIREYTAWGNTQLGVHLERLVKMEYLLTHRSGRGQSFVYELLYDGKGNEQPHISGLIDITLLKGITTTQTVRGKKPEYTGSKRPQNGSDTGVKRHSKNQDKPNNNNDLTLLNVETEKNAVLKPSRNNASYTQITPPLAAKGN